MIKYMLDTNIVIYVIKQRPFEVLATFNQHENQLCISSITLAELVHGAEKSAKIEHNLRQVDDFTTRLMILAYDDQAAFHYGAIRAELERKGAPIGINDVHIAGHARSRGLILVSNNLREFERVEGLRSVNWFQTDSN